VWVFWYIGFLCEVAEFDTPTRRTAGELCGSVSALKINSAVEGRRDPLPCLIKSLCEKLPKQ
jgi:hypothetical protein